MKNKTIQEERVKGYFIDAAIEILRGEGIRDLSVRNIAEKAGYSYATLYNYFKDLNEVLSICIGKFLEEGKEFISGAIKDIPEGKNRLEITIKSYVKFFIQYPGIFELFFITPLTNTKSTEAIISLLDEMCKEDWDHIIQNRKYDEEDIEIIKWNIKYSITGLLVLYNNRRYPAEYVNFNTSMNNQIDKMLSMI